MMIAVEDSENKPPRRPGASSRRGRKAVASLALCLTAAAVLPAVVVASAAGGYSAVLDGKACVPPAWDCASSDPALGSTQYHISPSGDDDNAGDGLGPSSAWRTPSRALEAAATDCGEVVVHLAPGFYGTGVGLDVTAKDAKEFAAREEYCDPVGAAGWVTFLGSSGETTNTTGALLSHVRILGVSNANIAVRSVSVIGTYPGSSNDNNAVNIMNSDKVRLDDVIVDPSLSSDPHWTDHDSMPQGIATRDASDVIVTRSSITGGRYGVVFRGTDLHLLNCDIGYQFADAVRIVSASHVTIEKCLIHDVADHQQTGEHSDGIQFFAAGPAGANPQPRDVVLRGNTFRNMAGQMIFVQSNYVDSIGYIENVVIEDNVLEKKTVDDAARPVQLQGVKNFAFEGNTVFGDVLIRWESEGYVRDNLIGNRLMVQTDSSLGVEGGGPTDHNVIGGGYLIDETTADVGIGPNSIVDPAAAVFADVENGDYKPRSVEACAGGGDGLHVGAIPCDPCGDESTEWWAPAAGAFEDIRTGAALFSARPARVSLGDSAELVASAAVSCVAGGSTIAKWKWSTSDGQSFESTTPYSDVLLSAAGSHQVTLVVEDDDGNVSPPLTRTVVVEAPPEPGLLAHYPLSSVGLADVSPAQHDAASYVGPNGAGATIVPSSCPGGAVVALDGTEYLQFPDSVRDAVNGLPSLTVGLFARPQSPGGQLLYKHVTVGLRVDASRVYCNVGTVSNGWWPEIKPVIYPGGAHVDGNWHHFAVTYDAAAGTVGCYFDGELVGTKVSHDPVKSGSWPMTAGVISHKFDRSVLTGDVAGVKVYDRSLGAEEMAEWAATTGMLC